MHANVADSDRLSWVEDILVQVRRLLAEERPGVEFDVMCTHVETLKSYAPHVYNLVADVRVRRTGCSNAESRTAVEAVDVSSRRPATSIDVKYVQVPREKIAACSTIQENPLRDAPIVFRVERLPSQLRRTR